MDATKLAQTTWVRREIACFARDFEWKYATISLLMLQLSLSCRNVIWLEEEAGNP
ncbi:MAG: hypothetical protein P8K80_01450 [Phycisphaerales bacterium]|nr:hypothetical protein [Phycisphaerales bacterium]